MLDAEFTRDRRHDIRIGAGHQSELVAALAMRIDQRQGFASNMRTHMLVHELAMPGIEQGARKQRQQLHLKAHVALDVERSRPIGLRELFNACAIRHRIEPAFVDDEMRPRIRAVDWQQRMVEIEKS